MPRALVTGHNGFVGRHMVRALEERGFSVYGADISGPTIRSHYPVDAVDYFNRRWSGMVYDLVVHLAYNVGGRAAIDGVNMNLARNMMLDGALFDWAVRTKQKAVMYFSSSAAYPVHLQQKFCWECDDSSLGGRPQILSEDWIDLDNLEQPDADYGLAKICGERMARAASNNGLRVHVLRPFSGYGQDQHLDYPFPSIIARAKDGDLTVWGPSGQCRDWIHISDVVEGALRVYEDDERRPVNLCTGRGVEMGELMRMAYAATDPWEGVCAHEPKITYDESKPTGVFYRVGSPDRMLEHYSPKITLEEGIAKALRKM